VRMKTKRSACLRSELARSGPWLGTGASCFKDRPPPKRTQRNRSSHPHDDKPVHLSKSNGASFLTPGQVSYRP